MKVLTLSDGTQLEVSDLSTFGDIVNVFGTRVEAVNYWANFTEKSLYEATLGDEDFIAIPQSMTASIDEDNKNVVAHYFNTVISPQPQNIVSLPEEEEQPVIPLENADQVSEESAEDEAEEPTEEEATEAEPVEEATEEPVEEAVDENTDEEPAED